MTLDKWATGDVITEGNINKRGIRRGTTSDRGSATTVVGDHYFNEDEEDVDAHIMEEARGLAARNPQLTSSYLERRLKIGSRKAEEVIELLENEGFWD